MLTVTVNDRPIEAPAIVERGRIFLPLRTVFQALGATVSYDGRQRVIVARNADRTLTLPLASDPVRLFGGRAYVPLRFVAENMGAGVSYDPHTQTVRVIASGARVTGLTPVSGNTVSSAFPAISAALVSANAAASDVVLQVDGKDVTSLATFDGSTITFLPRSALPRGHHTVTFSGHTLAGEPFSASWSFDTTLIPPPEGTARLQLCNLGFDYPLDNGGYGNTYHADIPAPLGYWLPNCAVTAVYTSWNGKQMSVPVPYVIALYTRPQLRPTPKPTPKPTPAPQPRHIEPLPRRAEPTPKPSSAPQSPRQARPSPHTTPGR